MFAFVDGSYLRTQAERLCGSPFIDIKGLASHITVERGVRDGRLIRAYYDDAEATDSSDPVDPKVADYWKRVERMDDVELRFGHLRARSRKTPRQQKGVDVLLAVDLVVGSFTRVFDATILISGDADFVPAIDEAKRRGVVVILCGFRSSMSEVLIDACDRMYELDDVISRYRIGMT
jgi:uncharacterized LabA/DUF88 family protein